MIIATRAITSPSFPLLLESRAMNFPLDYRALALGHRLVTALSCHCVFPLFNCPIVAILGFFSIILRLDIRLTHEYHLDPMALSSSAFAIL